MREVFADTFYWIALLDPREPAHDRAAERSRSLGAVRLVTTEPVMIEVLNHFSGYGPYWREQAVTLVEQVLLNDGVMVVRNTVGVTLEGGLELYGARLDKSYSLTDCVSMLTMRDREISEVLTHDHHFAQDGFVLLL